MLPVPDAKKPLIIVPEDNQDRDDDIIQVPIAPPIAPEAIITKDDNNN